MEVQIKENVQVSCSPCDKNDLSDMFEFVKIEQPPIPSREEVNCEIAIENERREAINRQNAPPTSFTKAKREKTKVMRIMPRQTGLKHVPYWNKQFYILDSVLKEDDCDCSVLFTWNSYIKKFAEDVRNLQNASLPVSVFTTPITDLTCPNLYVKCDCLSFLHSHVCAMRSMEFSLEHANKLGSSTLDLTPPVKVLPGVLLPNIWQMEHHNWNARFDQGFIDIERSNTDGFVAALWHYSCYVAKYGSFKSGFENLNDGIKFELKDTNLFMTKSKVYDCPPLNDKMNYFRLAGLFSVGVSDRDIPSVRKYYWDMRQTVSVARALAIRKLCRQIFNKRKSPVIWGHAKAYAEVKKIPELKAAVKFLEVASNIYQHIWEWMGRKKPNLRFSLNDVLMQASFYWKTEHDDYCRHGNLYIDKQYHDCAFHCCKHFHHMRNHVLKNPFECRCRTTDDVPCILKRDFPTNKEDEDMEDEFQSPRPNTPEDQGESEDREASYKDKFFQFCKKFQPGSVDESVSYPEEGKVSFSGGPSAWLERAVDYFFQSFTSFVKDQFKEFKAFIDNLIESIKVTCKSVISGIGDILHTIASPFVSLLDKLLDVTGLGKFVTNRNLTVDFYAFIVGFMFWNYSSNPVLRILIILYYFNHFNVITSAKEFIKYLKNSFYANTGIGESEEATEDYEEDEEVDKETNMFISFLTYLSTSNVTSVMVKACCALVFMITGIAALPASRASLCSLFVNIFRNLGFIGQGLTGLEKLWKVIAEFFPKLLKWCREKLSAETPEDLEAKKLEEIKKELSEDIFRFAMFVAAWNSDEGINVIKRNAHIQSKILKARPSAIRLKAASLDPRFSDVFTNPIVRDFNNSYKDFNKLYNIVYRVCAYGNFRQTPFHIQLMGAPGIGKSALVNVMCRNLRDKYFPDITMAHCVYTRGNTDHFDGYSNQPIMVQDDMWSSDDYKQVSEILPLVSSVPLIVPMAELVDKGTFFDSKFIVSTTNTAFPVTTAVRCQEAIWRRRHIFAQVSMDRECYDEQNGCVDVEKVLSKYNVSREEFELTLPHLRFSINSPLPGSGSNITPLKIVEYSDNNIPEGLEIPLVDLKYLDFMKQACKRYEVMRDRERPTIGPENVLRSTKELIELSKAATNLRQSPLLEGFNDLSDYLDDDHEETDSDDSFASEAEQIGDVEQILLEDAEENVIRGLDDEETSGNPLEDLLSPSELETYKRCLTGNPSTIANEIPRLRLIIAKYGRHLPASTANLMRAWISRGTDLDPEKANREQALSKLKKIPKPSKSQLSRIRKLESMLYGETSQPGPADENEIVIPECMDAYYDPVAGEMHGEGLGFDIYEGATYHKGKPTVIEPSYEDPNCYIRLCHQIFPETLARLDVEFNKPKFKSVASVFDWEESVRNSGIFSPLNFNPDKLRPVKLLREFYSCTGYTPDEMDMLIRANYEILDKMPTEFICRITKKQFRTPCIKDRKQEYHIVEDYAYRHHRTPDENIGVFNADMWDKMFRNFLARMRSDLSYNDKIAFEHMLENDPRNAFRRQRSWIKTFDSPLFYSTRYHALHRAFLSFPDPLKKLIVFYNQKGAYEKWYEMEFLRVNAAQAIRYGLVKYHSLIHRSPKAWAVGLADVVVTGVIAAYAYAVIKLIKTGVCKLFGIKDKETSRILFKRSPPGYLSRRDGPTSTHVEDVHRKLQSNIVYLKSSRSGYANGLGIDGQMILCNAHWIRRDFEAGEDFTIEWRPTPNSMEMWEARVKIEDIYIIPNSDAAIIKSIDFRFFSRINHLFLKQADLASYELPRIIHQTCINGEMQICWNSYATEGIVDSFKVDFLNNCISKVVEYRTPRVVGLSGSPVFVDLPYAQGRTIVGIQSCGNAFTCKAAVITQEDLAKIPFTTIIHDGPVLSTDKESCTGVLVTEHLVKVGSLPKEYVTGIVEKTSFSQTIFSSAFPSERIPAVLSAFDPRVPENTHPLAHSINKFGRNVIKCMPTVILDEAVDATARMIKAKLRRPLRELSLEESILGLKEEGFEKINLKTSPGLPWIWDRKLPGKRDWIQIGEGGEIDLLDPVVKHVFEFHDRLLNQGVIPANSFYEFPKDELRPIDKVIGPPMRTRSISVMSFVFSLLYRKYNLDLEAALHTMADGTFPLCVGINPMSSAWHHMYEELSRRNHEGLDFDISNWDGHFPGWLFEAVTKVTDECYGKTSTPRLALNLNACYGYTNFADLVLQKNRGMPSGFAGTANTNTVGHFIVFYCFYIILCRRSKINYSLDDFLHYIAVFFYGDDVIFTIDEYYLRLGITPCSFIELYREFGWPITSAAKNSNPDVPRPIVDLQFLKRSFQPDPLMGFAIVYGKIDRTVIHDLLHWQRKTPNDIEQLYININEALEFSYCHGREYYNFVLNSVNIILRRYSRPVMLTTYGEMRSRILSRYFGHSS